MRLRRETIWFLTLIGVATAGTAVFAGVKRCVERAVEERIVAAALRRGFGAQIASVSAGFYPLLALEGIVVANLAHRVRLEVSEVRFGMRPWAWGLGGPAWQVALGPSQVVLPGGLRIELQPSSWELVRNNGEISMRRSDSGGEQVWIEWQEDAGRRTLDLRLRDVDLSRLVQIQLDDKLLIHPGRVACEAHAAGTDLSGEVGVSLHASTRGAQLALLPLDDAPAAAARPDGGDHENRRGAGTPTNIEISLAAGLSRSHGTLSVQRLRMIVGKTAVSCKGRLRGGLEDPEVDLAFDVGHVDLAELLATAGLDLPAGADELGVASLDAHVAGRMQDPSSFSVSHHLMFIPPSRRLPAIERLRGPFVHQALAADGKRHRINVSPESPDFIPLSDVPPLFLRALLLSEDSDFYGHRGFDLNEIPVALATNWQRGTSARGASTISQQLAKNLFLSREKSISRKLQELALTLLMETTLSKQRILEIYLNVIEWGPGIYGLRPASRHYFGKEPSELSPKEMAFLVALIPGPIKYQHSFAGGVLSPSFEWLVTAVLAKLRSVDAITEEDYQAALAETLSLRPDGKKEERLLPDPSSLQLQPGGLTPIARDRMWPMRQLPAPAPIRTSVRAGTGENGRGDSVGDSPRV
ncbi:MAG: biosynthetic peptidoglycan transglycosylase [Acidobacteriota bacterium]